MAGERVRYETLLSRKVGDQTETRVMNTEMVPDLNAASGRLRGIVIVGHDLTLRKKKLQEVEANRKSLHALFMLAPTGICVYEGPDHVCALANPNFMKMLFGGPRCVP